MLANRYWVSEEKQKHHFFDSFPNVIGKSSTKVCIQCTLPAADSSECSQEAEDIFPP